VRAASTFVTVALLILTLGLHWALLQGVAWAGMLITYAQEASLQEAVAKTFDGQHPCPLCKVVKQGREQEKQPGQAPVKTGLKLDLGPIWQAVEFHFDAPRGQIPAYDRVGSLRADPPPKPRPRDILDGRQVRA
jgi:hypothetical protein